MAVWDSAERGMRAPPSHPWLAEALALLDVRLRRSQAVFEYTRNPACIFRLDIGPAPRALVLRDGTQLRAGERIARLHYWNEQIPLVPKHGATIGWARQMQRAIATSLRELAKYLESRPDLADIAVIFGEVPSGTSAQSGQIGRIMGHYGFEAMPEPELTAFGERLHRFGENILISLIVLAHNAGALRADTLTRVRVPIAMPRGILEKRFGGFRE